MIFFKNIYPILIVLVSLIICSCCDNTKTDSKYYKGTIINRAEDNFPLGMIRFSDLYDELENPARAIIYHKSDGDGEKFDLYDSVFFKVSTDGKYQFAIDVKDTLINEDRNNRASKEDFYQLLPRIQLNLHNADIHREGPKHTRRHLIYRVNSTIYFNSSVGNEEYWLVETRKEYQSGIENLIVRKTDFLANPEGVFFFIESGETIDLTSDNSPIPNNPRIFNFSITHDHTH